MKTKQKNNEAIKKLQPAYSYLAHVKEVYDGDTITVDIDLGFDIVMHNVKIRLYGIDAPEIRGPSRLAGIQSRDVLRSLILGQTVVLRTIKDSKGKYGRYLAYVHIRFDGKDININDYLVSKNYAVYRSY